MLLDRESPHNTAVHTSQADVKYGARFWRSLLLKIAGGVAFAVAAQPLNTNLSCSDKALLTGSSGFSGSLAVAGLPWGISSMPPAETPSAESITYSNDGTRCSLIGYKAAEVSLPRSKLDQRGRDMWFGIFFWGGLLFAVGIITLLGAMVIMAVLGAREHRGKTLIEILKTWFQGHCTGKRCQLQMLAQCKY